MKILKGLVYFLLAAVLMTLTAAWGLLGTQTGVRWLLDLGNQLAPGELAYESAQGDLLGTLRLSGLRYSDAYIDIALDTVYLSWTPGQLLQKVVQINQLNIKGIVFRQLQAYPETDEDKPFTLSDIRLPAGILVNDAQVSQVELHLDAQSEPVLIDHAQLSVGWLGEALQLSRLTVQAPQGAINANGRITPIGHYPMDLALKWSLSMDSAPAIRGQGRLQGDIRQLRLKQNIDGEAQAQIDATLNHLLDDPHWSLTADIRRFPAIGLSAADVALLRSRIEAKGNLYQLQSRVALKLHNAAAAADKAGALNLTAQYQRPTGRFKIQGQWPYLQWPLSGSAVVSAAQGRLDLSGTMDDYSVIMDTAVAGKELPAGKWHIRGKGDSRRLKLETLQGQVMDGQVQLDGDLGWNPHVEWNLHLSTRDLNPESLIPEWNGRLNLLASSQGALQGSSPRLKLNIHRFEGQLNGQPLHGQGVLNITPDGYYQVNELLLGSGRSTIRVNGELTRQWNMDWSLDVPDLAELLPQGQGQIHARGRLQGSRAKPVLEGELKAQELLFQGYRLATGESLFRLDLQGEKSSELRLLLNDLFVAGQHVPLLDVRAQGPFSDQRIRIKLEHAEGKLDLTAQGAYSADKQQWRGALDALTLTAKEPLGQWRLTRPTALLLSPRAQKIESLCLQSRRAEACAGLDRKDDQGRATLRLQGLALQRFKSWLPAEVSDLTGQLDVLAEAELDSPVTASLKANLGPGVLAYHGSSSQPISLPHHDTQVNAVFDNQHLQAQWAMNLGPHSAQGRLEIPRPALDKEVLQAPLNGKIEIRVADLDLLSVFVCPR